MVIKIYVTELVSEILCYLNCLFKKDEMKWNELRLLFWQFHQHDVPVIERGSIHEVAASWRRSGVTTQVKCPANHFESYVQSCDRNPDSCKIMQQNGKRKTTARVKCHWYVPIQLLGCGTSLSQRAHQDNRKKSAGGVKHTRNQWDPQLQSEKNFYLTSSCVLHLRGPHSFVVIFVAECMYVCI